ncbi:MAG: hypothetical protein HYR76_04835 [Ignavibacteria bacterium]|nr:hypothetical protein [Ignavibacteria bacterium]MBI3765196.1 hypothetical protein [Ignavibacteriales bacterium]
MKQILMLMLVLSGGVTMVFAGDDKPVSSLNTHQYYSGKVGYYQPSDGLNNGLLLGIDGITEFIHYNFFLGGAVEVYPKQSITIFKDPQPDGSNPPTIDRQLMILLPLHIDLGYKLFEITDADTRGYVGVGGGYSFYFYSVDYRSSSSGLLGNTLIAKSDSKNGGNVFGSIFARLLINQIFVEPRLYFASKTEDAIDKYAYVVNSSGYSITLGFQYH